MSYSSIFRTRMNAKGGNAHDRIFNQSQRYFESWFNNHVGKTRVLIDGIEAYAVFQDQNQNNNKDLSDDKFMVVENSTDAKVGSYVEWNGNTWMVFTQEHKTIATHKQMKIKQSNHIIKWMVGSDICGEGLGYPAFIQNQTLYTLGVSSSGNHAWIVNAKMMMYLQDNAETRAIQIGQRIVIGGAVYQVMFKDYVSRNGLINYLLEQDMVALDRDNLELGIADYYTALNSETTQVIAPSLTATEVNITGSDKARIGSTQVYEANVEIAEWTIADTEAVATVVEQTPTSIKIYIENNFKKVGSVISVIGKTADGAIGSKNVNIISPY